MSKDGVYFQGIESRFYMVDLAGRNVEIQMSETGEDRVVVDTFNNPYRGGEKNERRKL